jgi:hypothetical protein
MARLNIAKYFGTWSDGGGSDTILASEFLKMHDDDHDEVAKIVGAPALPSCFAGNWIGGAATVNCKNLNGYTFIMLLSDVVETWPIAGVVRQVGFNGYNSGTEDGLWKVKAFRPDGYGNYDFVGESEYLTMPVRAEASVHEWFLDSPFTVNAGDVFAWYFQDNDAEPNFKYVGGGYATGPGKYVTADVTYTVLEADFGQPTSGYYRFEPTGIGASESSYETSVVHIDLAGNYRVSRLEVFMGKFVNKDMVKIETSDNDTDFLEWIDHKFYTRWDEVIDGNDPLTFNGTRGVVYANIDGAPRYYKITFYATCFNGKTIYEIVTLNEEIYLDYKPSDWDLTAGNWIGERAGSLESNNKTRVDFTEPVSKDGYIYGIQFYGRVESAQKLTFYAFRDKGTVLELIAFSETVDEVTVSGTNGVVNVTLRNPLKVKQGDFIAVKGASNLYMMYDANATSTSPWNDPSNSGTGGIVGGVTVNNSTTQTEDWTIECIDHSTPGGEEFSVTGTESGLQTASAFAGIQYTSDDSEVQFTIQNNPPDYFVTGDKIYFSTVKQGTHWHINDIEITEQLGFYVQKTEFDQDDDYNIAFKTNQDIWTDEVWCNDADIGTAGEHETVRVYNKTGSEAEIFADICDTENKDLIQISADTTSWYDFGDAGLPVKLYDRENPGTYTIDADDYTYVYVRTNLDSGQDERKLARIMTYSTIVT